MNFIDRALANRAAMSDDDFLQEMAQIYSEPEVLYVLDQYPQYIRDVIYLIDYDTELQMEGLESVAEGSMSRRLPEIRTALRNCGALEEASILEQAEQLNPDSGDYDAQMEALEKQTALHQDDQAFWEQVRAYIGKHKATE